MLCLLLDMLQNHYERITGIRKEIGNDFHLMEDITKFRHFDLRTQDRFIQLIDQYPKLKSFLLESQQGDELFWIKNPITPITLETNGCVEK